MTSLLLAALAALLYGVADFSGGLAARKAAVLPVVVFSQAAGGLLAAILVLASGQPAPAPPDLAWGLAAGASGAAGLALLYRGLSRDVVAVVSPTAALVGAAIPVAVAVLSGERPGGAALAGTGLCLPAILFLSWDRSGTVDRGALRASLASGLWSGVFIGGFFLALAHTSPGAGLWPALAARASSIPLALAAAWITRERLVVSRASLAAALVAGLADMAANLLFLLAVRAGLLAIAVIVSSLYPAPTVLLARIFFRQRVSRTRALGMALAVAGVALIGLR